jgi:hypothetical protein
MLELWFDLVDGQALRSATRVSAKDDYLLLVVSTAGFLGVMHQIRHLGRQWHA